MWSFVRYADRIIREHQELYMFLEDFIEKRIREKCNVSNDYPTPDYEVIDVYKTDDDNIVLEVDVYDWDNTLLLTIKNDEVTEDEYFRFIDKH